MDLNSLGSIIEGTVEQDPLDDRYRIRTVDQEGKPSLVDLQDLLSKYKGQEIRLTLVSQETLQQIADLLEQQGGEGLSAVMPEDVEQLLRQPDFDV